MHDTNLNLLIKIPTLEERIKEFNALSYCNQCRHIANKLISLDCIEIKHTIFYKRLQIVLKDIPRIYLKAYNNQTDTYKYELNVQFYPYPEKIIDDILCIGNKATLNIRHEGNGFSFETKKHGPIIINVSDDDMQKDQFTF